MLPALRLRDFRLLWAARLLSNLGSWLLVVAIPARVFDLTGSTVATGAAFVAETLPALLLGPIAGVYVDRWQRRGTMLAVELVRAGCVLALLSVHRDGQVWVLYLAVFAENAAGQLFTPARQALVPAVTGRGPRLAGANALDALTDGTVRLVGAPVGGLLYAAFGIGSVVLADIASYLVSAVAIALVRSRGAPAPAASQSHSGALRGVTADLRDGARQATADRALRGLLVVGAIYFAANGALSALLVPFVRLELHAGARELGALLSALGAGYLLGAPLAGRLVQRVPLRRLVTVATAAVAGAFLALFNLPFLALDLVLLGLAGIPGVSLLVAIQTQVQQRTPDRLLGRVSAAFLTAQNAATVAGAALGAALGQRAGLPLTLNVANLGVVAASCAAARLLPSRTGGGDGAGER